MRYEHGFLMDRKIPSHLTRVGGCLCSIRQLRKTAIFSRPFRQATFCFIILMTALMTVWSDSFSVERFIQCGAIHSVCRRPSAHRLDKDDRLSNRRRHAFCEVADSR